MDYTFLRDLFSGKLELKDIIQAVYGLNYIEYQTLEILISLKEADVTAIMEKLGRNDRVLVNRCLKKLRECKLVERRKESAEGKRGYWYVYTMVNLEVFRNKLREILDHWHATSVEKVNDLENYFEYLTGVKEKKDEEEEETAE